MACRTSLINNGLSLLSFITNPKYSATDPVVMWQHSFVFVENCIHNGKLLDYFVYPGHDHNVYVMDRAHLIMKITQYFKDNL